MRGRKTWLAQRQVVPHRSDVSQQHGASTCILCLAQRAEHGQLVLIASREYVLIEIICSLPKGRGHRANLNLH